MVLAGGLTTAILAAAGARAGEAVRVENGGDRAVVRQGAGPASAPPVVVTRPGYTRIEQHDRNNSAVIVQESGPGAGRLDPDDFDGAMPAPIRGTR